MGKNTVIKELEKEVEYWRSIALNNEHDGFSEADTGTTTPSNGFSSDPCVEQNVFSDKPRLNLYESLPQLVTKGIIREDISPFSGDYLMIADPYLSTFLKFVFQSPYRNAMGTYLAGGMDFSKDFEPNLVFKILKLNPTVFNTLDPIRKKKANDFIEQIMNKRVPGQHESRNETFLMSLGSNELPRFIEDRCVGGQYSPILHAYINRIQHELPSMSTVRKLLTNYYSNMYVGMPYIDPDLFEECIRNVLEVDPNNSEKIRLNLGTTDIKHKLVNIAILFLILQLSISHYKFFLSDHRFVENNGEKFRAEMEWITGIENLGKNLTYSAVDLVSILNSYQSRSEELISWHLLLWAIFAYTPDVCSVFHDSMAEGIISVLTPLVTDLGLDIDPSEFPKPMGSMKLDPRYKNYRRRLWICFCIVCRYEMIIKGKFPHRRADDIKFFEELSEVHKDENAFLNLYHRDMPKENAAELAVIQILYQDIKFLNLLTPCDNMFKNNIDGLTINDIEVVLQNIEGYISNSSGHCSDGPEVLFNATTNCFYDFGKLRSILDISNQLLARTIRLALFDITMRSINTERAQKTLELKKKISYSQRMFDALCEAMNYLIQYFSTEFTDDTISMNKFVLNRAAQVVLSRCTLQSTLKILRIDYLRDFYNGAEQQEFLYEKDAVTSSRKKLAAKRQICMTFRHEFMQLIEQLCFAASEEFRYTYLSGFRVALLTDCGFHFLKENERGFPTKEILMADIEFDKKVDGFMETNFHLLSVEEKETLLLSANPLVHFDQNELLYLLKILDRHKRSDGNSKNFTKEPLFAYDFTTLPPNAFLNPFSVDFADTNADFDLVFNYEQF